jgi:hypothetical protein
MYHFVLLLPLLLAAAPGPVAPSPRLDNDPPRGELVRLLRDLDSDRFDVRETAARRIEQWLAKPELGPFLAAEFQRVLLRPDVSFEVRWRLGRWNGQLPAPPAQPAADASTKELDALVRQLDDDSYARRVGAAERLDWLLGNPKLICPVMLRLKRRLADGTAGAEAGPQLQQTWQRAHGAWLLSDPADGELPAVSDGQIGAWLDDLVGGGPSVNPADAQPAHETAQRELLDLLARDEYVPRLKKAIAARLSQKPDAAAAAKLQSLLDWTKPEIVAEIWQGRNQWVEQHLLVGVPTLSPGAAKPSHFDRADDHEAHCVSGNSLSPGDYPVGEAFPHPKQDDAFFHLVNLPTPRRRMAYPYYVETDESIRLAAISRRTLDRVLADRRLLNEPELLMLAELDPAEVSRFAGRYFLLVDDTSMAASGPLRLVGRPSRFGMICTWLAIDGSKDAMPGLAEAIAKDRFRPPTSSAPYRLDWLAALSIAARDPWPQVDDWLAGRIEESESLLGGQPAAAELGATAAAVLLGRHGHSPESFGLRPLPDPLMDQLHVSGYRFADAAARKKVLQWWKQEKAGKAVATNNSGDADSSTAGHSSLRRPPAAGPLAARSPAVEALPAWPEQPVG